MAENRNDKVIAEFRANEGRLGGTFEGAPVVLVHRGRTSGRHDVTPMMYLADDNDPDAIYVFASTGGIPTNRTGTTTSSQPATAPSSEAPTPIR